MDIEPGLEDDSSNDIIIHNIHTDEDHWQLDQPSPSGNNSCYSATNTLRITHAKNSENIPERSQGDKILRDWLGNLGYNQGYRLKVQQS